MLISKRAKLKQQMRKNDWNRKFSMKRKNLVEGSNVVIHELFTQVRNQNSQIDYDLISRLLQNIQINPQQQNSYLIIGNYLIDHPHAYIQFYHSIVDRPQILQNHSWCLYQMAGIILDEYSNAQASQNKPQQNKLHQILLCSSNVCQILVNQQYSPLKMGIYSFFQQILKMALTCPIPIQIDSKFIVLFCQILTEHMKQSISLQNIRHLVNVVQLICNKWQIFTQAYAQNLFIKQSALLIMIAFKNIPAQREYIIGILRKILLHNTSAFLNTYYNHEFLHQIFYTFQQVHQLKPFIVKFLKQLQGQVEIHKLQLLLGNKIHIHVTRCLQWSMNNYNNECLLDCLNLIYSLLNRLNQLNEIDMVNRILKQAEQQNFVLMINGLATNQQNQAINHVVNNIIDDFYSQQVM